MPPDLRPRARLRSMGHAWRGLRWMLRSQANARVHLILTTLVIGAGLATRLDACEWTLLVLAIALVWVAEAMNTAIECLADALHPEHHPLIGRAKDVAAGAVLLAALGALAVGVLILLGRFG
ncbi:diacylglycerol kinase family protein [Acidihalobacter prosperus]|uniref:Diacylglycerol kinase n=1 Tax=Acidihalobacter prosperus TaxID=160660 RepID=A0A1A6C3L0_9GAMM|nr:diacylglycerol kinase family protein [Acidihalobacter prosperus]OBS09144.1 hypothetical protein Thpro_021472 [Acidihalobacter prosperus]